MKNISTTHINDIATRLIEGCNCFIHRKTMSIIAIPNLDELSEEKLASFEATIEKIENNPSTYLAIEMPEDRELYFIMENFTNSLPDEFEAKKKLQLALKNRKPVDCFFKTIEKEKKIMPQWILQLHKGLVVYAKDFIDRDGMEED